MFRACFIKPCELDLRTFGQFAATLASFEMRMTVFHLFLIFLYKHNNKKYFVKSIVIWLLKWRQKEAYNIIMYNNEFMCLSLLGTWDPQMNMPFGEVNTKVAQNYVCYLFTTFTYYFELQRRNSQDKNLKKCCVSVSLDIFVLIQIAYIILHHPVTQYSARTKAQYSASTTKYKSTIQRL